MKFRKLLALFMVTALAGGLMVACDSSSPVESTPPPTGKDIDRTVAIDFPMPDDYRAIDFGRLHNQILHITDQQLEPHRARLLGPEDWDRMDFCLNICARATAEVLHLHSIPDYRELMALMPDHFCHRGWHGRVYELYNERLISTLERDYLDRLGEIFFVGSVENLRTDLESLYEHARNEHWSDRELYGPAAISVAYYSMLFNLDEGGFRHTFPGPHPFRIDWVDVVYADAFGLIFSGPKGAAIASARELLTQILNGYGVL